MSRVKKGLIKSRKHKKVLATTKGYRGAKSKLFRTAKEASMHAGEYAFSGRKQKKRQKRRLWVSQINSALKMRETTYSQFIKDLKDSKVEIDRKILANLANDDSAVFTQIIQKVASK